MITVGLYIAKNIMYGVDNIPYLKVNVIEVTSDLVVFETEWPVRKFNTTTRIFEEKFDKMEI